MNLAGCIRGPQMMNPASFSDLITSPVPSNQNVKFDDHANSRMDVHRQ